MKFLNTLLTSLIMFTPLVGLIYGANNQIENIISSPQMWNEMESVDQNANCSAMDQSGEDPILYITFLNDGLTSREFNEVSDIIVNSILRTPNFATFRNHIEFNRLGIPGQRLTQTQGLLERPIVDSNRVFQLVSSCETDHVIVLSRREFHPDIIDGVTYISPSACRADARCMTIYTLRGLAFEVFGLDMEPGTVTAQLSTNPDRSTLRQVLGASQQRLIREWFEYYRTDN